MRDFGQWTDEFGSLLGASRESPKEGGDGDGGQQGTFRNLMGHILFVRADFSMETRPCESLNPFTESLFVLPKRSFNPLQAEVFIGKALVQITPKRRRNCC
jgi:hypothetical protein